MIDEKKLIERLWEHHRGIQANSEVYTDAEEVADEICNVVSMIDEQPKVGEWIPCSERLPEESLNSVIGWDAYRERCCFVQYYNGRWILGNDIESVKIIAWMPLPEPYKESED